RGRLPVLPRFPYTTLFRSVVLPVRRADRAPEPGPARPAVPPAGGKNFRAHQQPGRGIRPGRGAGPPGRRTAAGGTPAIVFSGGRSEERRVGKEGKDGAWRQ